MSNPASRNLWKKVLDRHKTMLQYQLHINTRFSELFAEEMPTEEVLNKFVEDIEDLSSQSAASSAPLVPSAPSAKSKTAKITREKEAEVADKSKGKQKAEKSKTQKQPVQDQTVSLADGMSTVKLKSNAPTSEEDMPIVPQIRPPAKGKSSRPLSAESVESPVEITGTQTAKAPSRGRKPRNISAHVIGSDDDADVDMGTVDAATVMTGTKSRAGKRKASPAAEDPGPQPSTERSMSSARQRTAKRARVEEPSAELYPFPRKPSDEAFERMFEHPIFIKNYKMTGVNAASLVRQKKAVYALFWELWIKSKMAGNDGLESSDEFEDEEEEVAVAVAAAAATEVKSGDGNEYGDNDKMRD